MTASERLTELHGTADAGSDGFLGLKMRRLLPPITAVIEAAEWVRDGWELYEAGGDEAHMTASIESDLIPALAELNRVLGDTP